jgi:DNA repair protein RadC
MSTLDPSPALASHAPSPPGPRERALEDGIASLGDAELLAILLGTGLAGRPVALVAAGLLEGFSGADGLLRTGPAALAEHPGIGMAKALRISAALELGRRAALLRGRARAPVHTSADVAAWAHPRIGLLEHEEMWVVALDGRNGIRGSRRVAQGGLHHCAVSARDVLRAALAEAATSMVLVHNHPGGNATPSGADIAATRALAEAGAVVGLPLVDHLIVTPSGAYTSMLDLGILEPAEAG